MSILLLSLLLLLLVGIGALMGRRVSAMERFQNAPAKRTAMEKFVSGNPMTTTGPESHAFHVTGTVNVDPLARDIAVQDAVVEGGKKKPTPAPPAPNPDPLPPTPAPNPTPPPPPPQNGSRCPACPDMSQYIRMDEIPCWNCTLP